MSAKSIAVALAGAAVMLTMLAAAPAEARRGGGHHGWHARPHHHVHHRHVHRHVHRHGHRHVHRRIVHRRVLLAAPVFYRAPVVYRVYDDGCAWLKRRAIHTGSRYWWNRYYACRYGW